MSDVPAPDRPSRSWLVPSLVLVALVAVPVVYFVTFSSEPRQPPSVASTGSLIDLTETLEARVAADPDDEAAWQELAVAYTRRASVTGDPAFYDLADRAVARSEELAPRAPGTLIARGNLQLSLHQFDDAERTAEAAAAALPGNVETLGLLVDSHVELGDYDAAAEALQRMLDRDPGLPALSRTSYLRELTGDLDGAIVAMQQAELAASLPLDEAEVASLLGDLHRQRGDLDAADDAYARALQAADHAPARIGQLRVAAARDGAATVLPLATELVQASPRLDAILLQTELAVAAGDGRLASQALALARAATDLQGQAGQVVDLELALLEANVGDADRAVELAERAHAARPDNVFVNDALAWSLHRAGRSDDALPYLEQALRIGTVAPHVRFHAAAILTATGDTEAATAHLRLVADGDPTFDLSLATEAAALADELGVDAPPAWSGR